MISRIRIEGSANTPEELRGEFNWLTARIREAFQGSPSEASVMRGHELYEVEDDSLEAGFTGRLTLHPDISRQITPDTMPAPHAVVGGGPSA